MFKHKETFYLHPAQEEGIAEGRDLQSHDALAIEHLLLLTSSSMHER